MEVNLSNEPGLRAHQLGFLEGLKSNGRSFNTIKNYRTDLECFNRFIDSFKDPVGIEAFEVPFIEEYGDFLHKKYSSDNSRRRRVQTLRMFCDYLTERGILSNNPVRKLRPSPKFQDIPRPAPIMDIKTLWMHLIKESKETKGLQQLIHKRNQIIFLLIYGGGLKVSDLENLKISNIILDDDPRVIINPPKRDPYSVPLPQIFRVVFNSYMESLNSYGWNLDHLLFNANPYKILSGGISPRGLEKVFEEARNKLIIGPTPKSLRQACIFKWLHDGHSDGLIKEWMGVAPSYSLKGYKDFMDKYFYNEEFLVDLFQQQS
jgi:site-specific recombinase XerD